MYGSDASSNFLDKARKAQIYLEVFLHWFGTGVENFPAAHKDCYDLVTASGCFQKGHIEKNGLNDVYAALKVGGYFAIGWRTYRIQPGAETGFYEKLEEMEKAGLIKKVNQIDFMRGLTGKTLDEEIKTEFEQGLKRFEQQSSTISVYQKL